MTHRMSRKEVHKEINGFGFDDFSTSISKFSETFNISDFPIFSAFDIIIGTSKPALRKFTFINHSKKENNKSKNR